MPTEPNTTKPMPKAYRRHLQTQHAARRRRVAAAVRIQSFKRHMLPKIRKMRMS